MPDTTLEEYKSYVKSRLEALMPIFAKASIGDFSSNIEIPDEDDEFTQLFVGIQVMIEIINKQLSELTQLNTSLEGKITELQTLFESIGEGIVATDINNKIIMMNKPAQGMIGWSFEELEGKNIVEAIPMVDEKGVAVPATQRPSYTALTSGKKYIDKNHFYVRKDKTTFPVLKTVTPILLHGKIAGIMNVFRDITQEKELEALKDDFISLASHELRTPLSAIKGLVSMVQKGDYGPVNDNLEKPIGDIAFSTERLIYLVRDLLNVSRIEGKRILFNLTDVSLSDITTKVFEQLRPLTLKKRIGLDLKSESATLVQADKDKLIEILNNLIGNAIKFTYEGGITVSTKEDGEFINVYIEDTGIGISPDHHDKLFKKFQKIHAATALDISGSGLGLYIVRSYAKSMGGKVWLERSAPGQGTVFAFSLPKSGSLIAEEIKKKHGAALSNLRMTRPGDKGLQV